MSTQQVLVHDFVPDNFFCLRCPVLPFREYEDLGAALACADLLLADRPLAEAERAFGLDCQIVRGRMKSLIERRALEEAIRLASPSVVEALPRWRSDPTSKKGAAVERGLLKYLIRSMSRCTPFGALAGVARGEIARGASTDIRVAHPDEHRCCVRPDAQVLLDIARSISLSQGVRRSLAYRTNSTLYKCGSRLRYYEASGHPYGAERRLVSVRSSDPVTAVMNAASDGAQWDELSAAVAAAVGDVESCEMEGFLDALIDAQFLVAEVYPAASGSSMIQELIERLIVAGAPRSVIECLGRLDVICAESSRGDSRIGGGALVAAGQAIKAICRLAGITDRHASDAGLVDGANGEQRGDHQAARTNWLQVDLSLKTSSAVLQRRELESVMSAVDALVRIQGQVKHAPLREFLTIFERRFGDRLVPVSEALDPDGGIAYGSEGRRQAEPSPLLAIPSPADPTTHGERSPLDSWLLELACDAARTGEWQCELASREIRERFPHQVQRLPDSSAVIVSRLAGLDKEHPDRPGWYLIGTSGVHTLALLGRFGSVLGSQFVEDLRRCARHEQVVTSDRLCEVRYLPPGRLGNVCQQPRFREHAIVYLSPRGPDGGVVHNVGDLYLMVSGGQLRLWSARSEQVLKPRIDHALNVDHDTCPALFSFLGALQQDGRIPGASWTWSAASGLHDLPRVMIDGVMVSPRTWNLTSEEVAGLCGGTPKGSLVSYGFAAFRRVQDWRKKRCIPRWVAVGTTLNYLTIDLNNPLAVGLFLSEVGVSRRVFEAVAAERANGVGGNGAGGYVNELVIPLWNAKHVACEEPIEVVTSETGPPLQLCTRGCEMKNLSNGVLQAKIYGGELRLDQFLREELGAYLGEFCGAAADKSWFFIRYSDPDFHLRVRIFGPHSESLIREARVLEELVGGPAGRGLQRIVFDGYQPEYQRYGGIAGVAHAEALFCIDSSFVIDLIRLQSGSEKVVVAGLPVGGPEGRWILAALSADAMLGDLGFDLEGKLAFTGNQLRGLTGLPALPLNHRMRVGELSRQSRDLFAGLLVEQEDMGLLWVRPCRELMAARSQRLAQWALAVRTDVDSGAVPRTWQELVGSYFHMHCNRMFQSQMRRQEVVLIQLLQRAYRAQIERGLRCGDREAGGAIPGARKRSQ